MAIHNRLKGCVPWAKVLLNRMMSKTAEPLLEGYLAFLIVDGSKIG